MQSLGRLHTTLPQKGVCSSRSSRSQSSVAPVAIQHAAGAAPAAHSAVPAALHRFDAPTAAAWGATISSGVMQAGSVVPRPISSSSRQQVRRGLAFPGSEHSSPIPRGCRGFLHNLKHCTGLKHKIARVQHDMPLVQHDMPTAPGPPPTTLGMLTGCFPASPCMTSPPPPPLTPRHPPGPPHAWQPCDTPSHV